MKIAIVVGILVCLVLVGLVSAADDFEDDFDKQNVDGEALNNLWLHSGYFYSGDYISITTTPHSYSYALHLKTRSFGTPVSSYAHNKYPSESSYWSFIVRKMYVDINVAGDYGYVCIKLLSEEKNEIFSHVLLEGGDVSRYPNDLYELNIIGNNVYLLINGNSQGIVGTVSEVPHYLKFYVSAGSNTWTNAGIIVDNVNNKKGSVGAGSEPGLYTITELDNNEIDVSWAVKTIPKASYDAAEYTMKVKRLTYDEYYNTTTVKDAENSTQKPTGFVVYNWTKLFQTDHYGLYSFQLYKSDEEEPIASDWLYFKELGQDSWIDIAATEYTIGSTMDISYHIDTPDFGLNDYHIQIFDSSHEKVAEQEVFTEDGSVDFTSTITWDVGTAYAVLVKDTEPNIDMSPPTDIVDLAYDYTYMSNKIFIRGTCYDATNPDSLVDGTPLSGVNVSMYHNNQWYENTTDANGNYRFLTSPTEEMSFYMDVPIDVNASKAGYNHENFTTEIIRAGTYYIDLYLVPTERNVNQDNSSIAGLVLDSPFYQAIPGATVHIENDTWSTTTTTNTWGYYIFDYEYLGNSEGLGNNTYDVWVTKETYSETSKEEVQAHDVVHTLDNCDTVGFYNVTLDNCDSLTDNGYWQYASIFNESFNSSICNSSWVQLNYSDLRSNSQTVTNTTTTFVNNTDYKMNYTDGKIQIICTGDMESNTTYNISYQYKIGNSNSIDSSDFIEGTGALNSTGSDTIDFIKTFTTPIDSNVSKEHGLLYFYSQILDKTHISDTNITITIGSNGDNSTNTITWDINKDVFEVYWNMTSFALSEGTEVGTCNLSAINYFEWKTTKSGSVTTKIDDLHFIMWTGWDTNCLDLSTDTVNKKEGVASIYGEGTGGSGLDGYLAKYFLSPIDASDISKTGKLSRMEFWEDPYTTSLDYVLVSKKEDYDYSMDYENYSGSNYGYMFWDNISVGTTWNLRKLYLNDAYENNFTTSSLEWFEIVLGSHNFSSNYKRWIDNIQIIERGRTYQNFHMNQYYTLTVYAKEMDTHNTITEFNAVWNTTNIKETTIGTIVFENITYGIYSLEVNADDFYTSKQYIFMGQNTEETVYLMKTEAIRQYYSPPHLVEFRIQNIYGTLISDVYVDAQGYETTMVSWDLLYSIFGFSPDTPIHNVSMNGTTDSTGTISFMMTETIKYKINFTKPSENIDETLTIYPKESQYLIILTPTGQPMMIDYLNWNLSVEEIPGESENRSLNFTYNDSMDKTSKICFFVKDENKTEMYSNCSFPDNSSVDTGWKVKKESGATYYWGFNCTHDTFGELKGTKAVTFKSRLIDLQLENESYYSWISIALLVMITSLFSAVTVKFGYVVVPFIAGFFWYIGFLEIAPTLLTIIIILGILLYIGRKERESGL